MLVLQWLLYLASTIGSYYKWWAESDQGPAVYTFSSTPIEDLEGPMHELKQECTWMDHKMSVLAPPSPPANVSGPHSPPESASGELLDAPASDIVSGAALVRPATAAASTPVGPHPTPPHIRRTGSSSNAGPSTPAPAPQHQARHQQPLPRPRTPPMPTTEHSPQNTTWNTSWNGTVVSVHHGDGTLAPC